MFRSARLPNADADIASSAAKAGIDAAPRVWILLGGRTGDDNQVRGLAEALSWPFEAKTLRYNEMMHFAFLRDERLLHLTAEARAELVPPWPDLVIGLGYESISVARFIRRQSQGRTRLIQLGNPRTDNSDIDLVIATPQYPLPPTPNLLQIPFPIGNPAREASATESEKKWLEAMPRPRRLVAVGGSTRQWKLDVAELDSAVRFLKDRRARTGGSVIAVTSRRTPPEVSHRLRRLLDGEGEACVANFPRFSVLLAQCDEFYVTADSVSMLAEAMLTNRPVGMIPIRRSRRGRASQLLRTLGVPLKPKADLSGFWTYLSSRELVGSVAAPVASAVSDTTEAAVVATRALMQPRSSPKIWALLGAHHGDNNQVLALAEAIGLPFERKQLTFNRWRYLRPHLLGATFRSLTPPSRAALSGELPDLTISTGHRSVPGVQALRQRSGGRIRSIHVGYPRISPANFDLVIATPEYPIPDHPNLLRIPFALTRKVRRREYDAAFWERHPSPRRLLILGGATLYWRLSSHAVSKALNDLLAAADAEGGSVIVVGSPRTRASLLAETEQRIRRACTHATLVPEGGRPSYPELLRHADTFLVTADSVAMVSDAIATGKPVALLPVFPSRTGRLVMGLKDRLRPEGRLHPRDLRTFWHALREGGFVETAGAPGSSQALDVNRLAVMRAKAILDQKDPEP